MQRTHKGNFQRRIKWCRKSISLFASEYDNRRFARDVTDCLNRPTHVVKTCLAYIKGSYSIGLPEQRKKRIRLATFDKISVQCHEDTALHTTANKYWTHHHRQYILARKCQIVNTFLKTTKQKEKIHFRHFSTKYSKSSTKIGRIM